MLTGELRSQVDRVWDSFWSGGIANPLEVIEQITYLLFIRRLDELQTLEENKSAKTNKPIERRIFPEGQDSKGRNYQDMRWSRLKNSAPQEMFTLISEHVFPFLRELGGDGSTYSKQMQGARFTIPTPALLAKVVDLLDQIPMQDRDTKGDLYEYMLGKIASAGQNGQFRTPRHIIQLMVDIAAPTPKDIICDPASGTCGFLVMAGEYLREHHPNLFFDETSRQHFHHKLFHGYDFDNTMLRIGSMNMLLHGVDNPSISYRDSLSQDYALEEEQFSLILANPPFAGSLDYDSTARDLLAVVKTKKTELLFLALFLKLLKPGGRAAVIVPDGVLFGSSKAHKELRQKLVEEQKLEAVISLPSGAFKPYAGVSTAILVFTKTNSGGTDTVWFYDMKADGWSLDDKRQPLLDADKLGTRPLTSLTIEEHLKNNLPDVLTRWHEKEGTERNNPRIAQSFTVPKADIAATGYDLSLNRYKEVVHAQIDHIPPTQLIAELKQLESEIQSGLVELENMLASTLLSQRPPTSVP
jgi:type I restriction enzyme M protein